MKHYETQGPRAAAFFAFLLGQVPQASRLHKVATRLPVRQFVLQDAIRRYGAMCTEEFAELMDGGDTIDIN